jgi:hypothetical protein
MASASDFFDELKGAHDELKGLIPHLDGVNTRLDDIKGKLDALKAATDAVRGAVDHVDKTLQWGFGQLITIGNYTNQALFHNDEQNDTIICILEHISKNTCELLNEAHTQTGLQRIIRHNTTKLADLYAATHADAALERERLEALRREIQECCPPKPPPPVCQYEPCPKPESLAEPPTVSPKPPDTDPQPTK